MNKELKPGMWILRDSIFVERRFGQPTEVVKISGKRIYMRRPHRTEDGLIEEYTEKHGSIDLVKAVFDTEDEAWAAYHSDAALTQKFEEEVNRLRKEMNEAKDKELGLRTK
jgi:hypothetical protein